jgi:hypothetical protein
MKRMLIALFALCLAGCNAAKPTPSSTPLESLITGPYQFQFVQPCCFEDGAGTDTVYEVNVTPTSSCPTDESCFIGSGITFDACDTYQASQPPPTGCVTVADVSTFWQLSPLGQIQGSVDAATGQVTFTVPYSATGTQTANGFSGTWSQGGVSGTWFATKAITSPAAATFKGSEGQWTMTVSGTTATLSNPDTSYSCTIVANGLVCPFPGETPDQSPANFLAVPDSTVPTGFDLAWIGDGESGGFIELLTDQN